MSIVTSSGVKPRCDVAGGSEHVLHGEVLAARKPTDEPPTNPDRFTDTGGTSARTRPQHCPAAVTNGYRERYAAGPLTHSRDRCDLLENRDDDRLVSGDELLAVTNDTRPHSISVQP
jgi:hypothetical protein